MLLESLVNPLVSLLDLLDDLIALGFSRFEFLKVGQSPFLVRFLFRWKKAKAEGRKCAACLAPTSTC